MKKIKNHINKWLLVLLLLNVYTLSNPAVIFADSCNLIPVDRVLSCDNNPATYVSEQYFCCDNNDICSTLPESSSTFQWCQQQDKSIKLKSVCCSTPTDSNNSDVVSGNISLFNETIGINENLGTVGGIISSLLPWLLVIAGLILFIMLISGGFTLMTATSNPDKAEKGKKQLTAAIMGFLIIFASYWIIQIIEIILGINILGNV